MNSDMRLGFMVGVVIIMTGLVGYVVGRSSVVRSNTERSQGAH
jgi:hypothetical protein